MMQTGDGDVKDRKTISGYLFEQGGAAITWRSCVSLSTVEAEYMALAEADLRKLCGCRN